MAELTRIGIYGRGQIVEMSEKTSQTSMSAVADRALQQLHSSGERRLCCFCQNSEQEPERHIVKIFPEQTMQGKIMKVIIDSLCHNEDASFLHDRFFSCLRIFPQIQKLQYERRYLKNVLLENHCQQMREMFGALQSDIAIWLHVLDLEGSLDLRSMQIHYDWEGLAAIFRAIFSQFETMRCNAQSWLNVTSVYRKNLLEWQALDAFCTVRESIKNCDDLSVEDMDKYHDYSILKSRVFNDCRQNEFSSEMQSEAFNMRPSSAQNLSVNEEFNHLKVIMNQIDRFYDYPLIQGYWKKVQQSLTSMFKELSIIQKEYMQNTNRYWSQMENEIQKIISIKKKKLINGQQIYLEVGQTILESIQELKKKEQEFFNRRHIYKVLYELLSSMKYLWYFDDTSTFEDPEDNVVVQKLRQIENYLNELQDIYDCCQAAQIQERLDNIPLKIARKKRALYYLSENEELAKFCLLYHEYRLQYPRRNIKGLESFIFDTGHDIYWEVYASISERHEYVARHAIKIIYEEIVTTILSSDQLRYIEESILPNDYALEDINWYIQQLTRLTEVMFSQKRAKLMFPLCSWSYLSRVFQEGKAYLVEQGIC